MTRLERAEQRFNHLEQLAYDEFVKAYALSTKSHIEGNRDVGKIVHKHLQRVFDLEARAEKYRKLIERLQD